MRSAAAGFVLLVVVAFAALGVLTMPTPAAAQDTLRLGELQRAAPLSDPRVRQLALAEAATDLRLRNVRAERLPALRLTGEAVHQSEVPALSFAPTGGVAPPTPPKDRYEVALGADWLFWDGGVRGARLENERATLATTRAEVEAALHPLRMEVTEAFFSAFLLQERAREVEALLRSLDTRLDETRERVLAGAALPGDTAAVRAERLRALQQWDEALAGRRAALAVLAELTGRQVSEADVLALPELDVEVARVRGAAEGGAPPGGAGGASSVPAGDAAPRVHPQYAVFDARREALARDAVLVRARTAPQVSAFGQLAYGRPGFEMFTDDPHPYGLAGVRVQWVPWTRGVAGRELETLRIQQEIVATEEAAFTARLARQLEGPLQEMERLGSALEADQEIIALREQIERQAAAQFAEGAITAASYVDALTDVEEARLALVRHTAELARSQAVYLTTLGVELR
jgi:outer membrane protein TolC